MTRVLVPVAILEGETVSPGLVRLLATVDVTVLGYHVLPEQTPPDQARLQYEDRAVDALTDLSDEFRAAGGAADHRLVFTHDREQSLDRVADDVGADAVAVPGTAGDIGRILVSLSGSEDADRLLGFVTEVVGDRDIGVTLFLATGGEDGGGTGDGPPADERLDAAASRLRGAGIEVAAEAAAGGAFEGLLDRLPGHDAIVMGEAAPSLRSLAFGDEADRVASASVGPVLVVRRDEPRD